MEKAKKIKLFVGIFYLTFIFIFLYYFFSKFSLQEIKSFKKDGDLKGRQFYRFNNDEFIVRLHIGLEDPKDLINDLKKGLKKIK